MRIPVDISYRSVPYSQDLEHLIRSEAEALERKHPALIGCRVALEAPHIVHVRVTLPGLVFSVIREHGSTGRSQLDTAIQAAFADIHQQLEDRLQSLPLDASGR